MNFGDVAPTEEQVPCKHQVEGSNPFVSTQIPSRGIVSSWKALAGSPGHLVEELAVLAHLVERPSEEREVSGSKPEDGTPPVLLVGRPNWGGR